MIKNVIRKGSAVCAVDGNGQAWLEARQTGCRCAFALYNQIIPKAYRGEDAPDIFSRTVNCNTEADARTCGEHLTALIRCGYGEKPNWWWLPLDLCDLMRIFADEGMLYLHKAVMCSDADWELTAVGAWIKDALTCFISVRVSPDVEQPLALLAHFDSVETVCGRFWLQIATDGELTHGKIEIDVWYAPSRA